MLSLLCIFSGMKELSLSNCALTTAWCWPNLCSSVVSTSLYIILHYANSAIAVLSFPFTRDFKYVNLTSSVKDCESMALLNCSNHLCLYRVSTLYSDNYHSIVRLTSDCIRQLLYQFRGVQWMSQKCGMRWATPIQPVRKVSSIRLRNNGSDKGGGGTCGRNKWIRLLEVCCYVTLEPCCCLYMRGAERCSDMRVD